MMVVIERSYRYTVQRLFAIVAVVFGIVTGRAHADSAVVDPQAVSKVFQDAGQATYEFSSMAGGGCSSYGESYYESYYQSYYQTYYQSYYQTYYQAYYQGSYQTVFTKNATVRGNFAVTGNISKGSGTFLIDHPLFPHDYLLFHSFVESPDVKNFYDGIIQLDANGEATVELPSYFDALNKDARYQIKPVDKPMPNLFVKEEEKDNRFVIGGGVAGGKVSWQVTGTRHDPYIVDNPIVPVVEKGPDALVEKGTYLLEKDRADISQILPGFDKLLRDLF